MKRSNAAIGAIAGALCLLILGTTACGSKQCTLESAKGCDKRCEQGSGPSCALGATIAEENGDRKLATEMFLKGCLHEYAPACYSAGLSLLMRKGGNMMLAARAFATGCELTDRESCVMKIAVDEMMKTRSPEEAFQQYQLQCYAESPIGCTFAGDDLVTGRGHEVDMVRGTQFLQRACTMGEKTACERLSQLNAKAAPPAPSSSSRDGGAPIY